MPDTILNVEDSIRIVSSGEDKRGNIVSTLIEVCAKCHKTQRGSHSLGAVWDLS